MVGAEVNSRFAIDSPDTCSTVISIMIGGASYIFLH